MFYDQVLYSVLVEVTDSLSNWRNIGLLIQNLSIVIAIETINVIYNSNATFLLFILNKT